MIPFHFLLLNTVLWQKRIISACFTFGYKSQIVLHILNLIISASRIIKDRSRYFNTMNIYVSAHPNIYYKSLWSQLIMKLSVNHDDLLHMKDLIMYGAKNYNGQNLIQFATTLLNNVNITLWGSLARMLSVCLCTFIHKTTHTHIQTYTQYLIINSLIELQHFHTTLCMCWWKW